MTATPKGKLGGVVRLLLRSGLISAESVYKHGLLARDTSRSRGVVHVSVGGTGGFVVKTFPPSDTDDLQGSFDRELSLYQLVSNQPSLSSFVPAWHPLDERDLLAIESVQDAVSVAEYLRHGSLFDQSMARELGSRLAQWHTAAGSPEELRPVSNWVFRIFADDRPNFLETNSSVAEWCASFRLRKRASTLLAEAAGDWDQTAVIHGDLRFDNWLLRPAIPSPELTLIDWEQSGLGDPAWDLASLWQEYLGFGGIISLEFGLDPRLLTAMKQSLEGYRSVAHCDDRFIEKVALFTGAKMLHRAIQLVSWQQSATSTADPDRHALLGIELLEDPARLLDRLDSAATSDENVILDSVRDRVVPGWVREDFEAAAELVHVRSGRSAVVDGNEVMSSVAGAVGGAAALSDAIEGALYGSWYLGRDPSRSNPASDLVTPADLDFIESLSAAHADADRFESGWIVRLAAEQSGRVRVEKNGEFREIALYNAVTDSGLPPAPGDEVSICSRIDWLDPDTSTWWTRSSDWTPGHGSPVRRIYFNVRGDSFSPFVGLVTTWLAESGLTYALKIQTNSDHRWRPDVAVAYIANPDALEESLLHELAKKARPLVKQATPRLTLAIGPGVGVADGVVGGRSFGQIRCMLVADGIVAGTLSGVDPVVAVIRRFLAAGLDPAEPWRDSLGQNGN